LTIHFDYGLDMFMLNNPALRSLLKGDRITVPGQFHKTHLAICPLGNNHFAFGVLTYGSRHGEQILVEQLGVSRIAYEAITAVALPPDKKFQPLKIEPSGKVNIRSNGLQRSLALGGGLAMLAAVIAPWFFLGWKMCLAIHVATSALLAFLGNRSEDKKNRHRDYIHHASTMIRNRIDDLRYEDNAAELQAALAVAQDMLNARPTGTERSEPFMVEILASRYAWLLKALQEIETDKRVSSDVLYMLNYVTSPITKRQILSYCFGRMPVRTLEQQLFYGRFPGGSAAT